MRVQLNGINPKVTIVVDGREVEITYGADPEDGTPFIQLGGANCNLEGDEPGTYYLTPLAR